MISKVARNIYRGPRPTEEDYVELKRLGVTHILNLEDDKSAILRDKTLAVRAKMFFYSLPMSEIRRPKTAQLLEAVLILKGQNFGSVYVHCLHGQDRTGYVIAAYRMLVQNWSFSMAYQEAKDYGHKWWFAPYLLLWPKSLKELQ